MTELADKIEAAGWEADRQLARCLDMLTHIQNGGFYPGSDQAAREEFADYIAGAERARTGLHAALRAQQERTP